MGQLVLRFLIGGAVVSLFAILGDVLKPKSFAGLFGAAPSVALATLALTVKSESARYASAEARSMMLGALALFLYTSVVSWILMRYRISALAVSVSAIPMWAGIALGLWYLGLR